jgi:serine phosphatase RsbU (regulator of sigma subunit)
MKYLFLTIVSLIILCHTSLVLGQTYVNTDIYLVDSLDLSTIGGSDLAVLDSYLEEYRTAKDKKAKVSAVNQLITEMENEDIWVRYNDWLFRFLSEDKELDVVFKTKMLSSCLNNFGVINQYKGDVKASMKNYLEALELSEKINDEQQLGNSYMNLGSLFNFQLEEEKAMVYFRKGLVLFEKFKDTFGIGETYNNLGLSYDNLDQPDSAIFYYNKGLDVFKSLNDDMYISLILNNLGSTYDKIGKSKEALQAYIQSAKVNVALNNEMGMASTFNNIANAYYDLGNVSKAKEYAIKSHEISMSLGYPDFIKSSARIYSMVSRDLGDYKKAYELFHLFVLMKDSIEDVESQRFILDQKYNYEYAKKAALDSVKFAQAKKVSDAKEVADMAIVDKQKAELKSSTYQKGFLYTGIGLLLVFGLFIVSRLKSTKKQKCLIENQKKEVEVQRDLSEKQRLILHEKNSEILDSINYAKRLQDAILPSPHVLREFLPNSFLLYQPKDIIAGDFYWMEHIPGKENEVWYAVADCTGHGVPGAMVSVVCANALNRAFHEFELREPGEILDKVKELVIRSFDKSDEEIKDGMDIGLCRINFDTLQLSYAGANNPLYIVQAVTGEETKYVSKDGELELIEVKGTKQPIGKYDYNRSFETNHLKLKKGDVLYLSSDGYPDQFGGPKGKKFKYANFKRLLLEIRDEEMGVQEKIIQKSFNDWKGEIEQVDDVCVIGLEF